MPKLVQMIKTRNYICISIKKYHIPHQNLFIITVIIFRSDVITQWSVIHQIYAMVQCENKLPNLMLQFF